RGGPAGPAQQPGHGGPVGARRRGAGPGPGLGLPDRRPRAVRLGPRHGRSPSPPGGIRVPARLRTRPEETAAMSRLRIFANDAPHTPLLGTEDPARIRAELEPIGVDFQRWEASAPVAAGDPPEKI